MIRCKEWQRMPLMVMITAVLIAGCTKHISKIPGREMQTSRYYSELPYPNCSADLERITHSVKKVNCYATYRTYVFGENSRITLGDLLGNDLLEQSQARVDNNESVSGTALVIYSDSEKIALLTCAHIAVFPDTVIRWSEHSDLQSNRYIHSISVKLKQQLYVRDIPDGGPIKVLASSVKDDIALLGRELRQPAPVAEVFGYPVGHSDLLEFGSFVYLLGYPLGQLMVTRGVVSKPYDQDGNFITDAPFNEGFSGGIAVAVRKDKPELEFVGMGRSVAARTGYTLKPERQIHEYSYNPAVPYSGNIYVKEEKEINYGISFFIPVNRLKSFYDENRKSLLQEGFNLDGFFTGMNNHR